MENLYLVLDRASELNLSLAYCKGKGLLPDQIEIITKGLSIKLSDELKQLYAWGNGYAGNISAEIFPGEYWLPLLDAVRTYEDSIALNEPGMLIWEEQLFPFLEDGGGGTYCVASQNYNQPIGPVINRFGEDLPRIVSANLETMFNIMILCFEKGIFWMDGEKVACDDYDAWQEAAVELGAPGPFGDAIYLPT